MLLLGYRTKSKELTGDLSTTSVLKRYIKCSEEDLEVVSVKGNRFLVYSRAGFTEGLGVNMAATSILKAAHRVDISVHGRAIILTGEEVACLV